MIEGHPVKCYICEKYQIPVREFKGKNDVELVTRCFRPDLITCASCNCIVMKGDRYND